MIRHPRKKKLQDSIAPLLLSTKTADCPKAQGRGISQSLNERFNSERRGNYDSIMEAIEGMVERVQTPGERRTRSVETAYGFEIDFIIKGVW